MNRRIAAAGALTLATILGGCGGGGGTGGSPGALPSIAAPPQQLDDQDLPQWALNLPEGIAPRDNEHTATAELEFQLADASVEELRLGRWQNALAAAEAGMALDPENPQSHLHAGRAHLYMGDFVEADRHFDRAEELYPRYQVDTEYYREVAWIQEFNAAVELIANSSEALPHLQNADLIYQWRPEAMMQLGQIYADQNRLDEAIDVFLRGAAVVASPRAREGRDPDLLEQWDALREIAMLNAGELMFAAERYADATSLYEEIFADNPDDLGAAVNFGIALTAAGETSRATDLFENLMSRPGLSPRELMNIGAGLERGEQLYPAAQAFGRAHEIMPMDRESIFYQANSLFFAGEDFRLAGDTASANPIYREVVAIGDELISLDPRGSNAHTYYFNSLLYTGQINEANDIFLELEALEYQIEGWNMVLVPGGVAVAGQVVNLRAAPGTQVRVRVHLYDGTGAEVGTRDASVNLPGAQEAVVFQVELGNADVMGYSYEVLE